MPYSPEHPSDWTLELLAEAALPPDEQAKVAAHVEMCARCSAELDTHRTLFAAIDSLPQFSPSVAFADTVMARVRMAPQATTAAWLTRWLPATRRGWMLLIGLSVAPALPVIALLAWLLTSPLVSPAGLWEIGTLWVRDAGWSLLVGATGTVVESGAVVWAGTLLEQLREVPTGLLVLGILLIAVGTPLSVWTLYRTLRTPQRGTVYAH